MAYFRYPHVHGDLVTFVADDDLWLGSVDGGRAERLTADGYPPRSPRFSPSGEQIAFTCGVGGGNDVHVLDLSGERRRITWVGARRMLVSGWLDDEHVLVASDHAEGIRAMASLYSVSLDGDMEKLPWGPAMAAAVHPDGRVVVASPNFMGPEGWKRYRGGMAVRLWVSDRGQRTWTRLLTDQSASLQGPAWYGDRVMFTSDLGASLPGEPDEQAQVWSAMADGSDLRDHTRHTLEEGYVRDATTDGSRIVYHAQGQLYVMESLEDEPRRLEITCAIPEPVPMTVQPTERLEQVVPDHGGDASLLEWRGAAWFITHRGGPARALSDLPGVRIREPRVLGTSGRGIWASDAEGEDCLEIAALDGDGDPRRIAHGRLGRVLDMAPNPSGTHVAVASHDGRVLLVDTTRGSVKQAGRSADGEATGLAFSPDGRYLVWREAIAAEGALGRIAGYDTVEGKAFQLTKGQFNDFSPTFSLCGKYLYLLSSRTIDPTYDELGFDLVFTNTVRPYLIPLRAEDPAPFGPSADGWALSEPEDDKPTPEETPDAAEHVTPPSRSTDDSSEEIVFDIDGAEERMLPLPVASGRYTDLQAVKDGVIWRRATSVAGELGTGKVAGDEAKDTIEFYDAAQRKQTTVVDGCDQAAATGDGKRLVVRNGEEIWVQAADSKPDPDDEHARTVVDLSRLRRQLNPRDEWRQMFDENCRLMRDHYWREDMDGVDWEAVCRRYRPLVEELATHDDLIDLLWEVVGELNTSHAYVMPPTHTDDAPRVGWLGAEFTRNAKGEVVISRILPGETSDPTARSPLRAAGVAAREGDLITAVDGQSVAEVPDIGVLLQGAADKVVELTLARGRMKRRVAVVPVASEASLRYHAWVKERGDYVRDRSGGRVGYVHVPDMGAHGWAEFQRLIEQASQCEAMIADVRYNGGGHTSSLIIERLARRVAGWGYGRHYDKPASYPFQAMRGPVVFVTNSYAGSDGDIVTAAAQTLNLGPVVGERSWGGVVGIDGRFQLVDGTDVTQPRYAFAFTMHGFTIENQGTIPDIEVPVGPAEWAAGTDVQLDVAVAEALRRLAQHPAAEPLPFDPPRAMRPARAAD